MKNEKEIWIDDIFESLEGSDRALPPSHLFSKIEQNLTVSESNIIPLMNYRMAIAASFLLLVMNIAAMYQHTQTISNPSSELINNDTESLISDFNLYDL